MISTAAVTELHQLHIGKDGVLTIGGAHSSVGGVVVVVVGGGVKDILQASTVTSS